MTVSADPEEVPSPCVGQCSLDVELRRCRGCLRHIDEIRGWRDMSAADKRAVWERLRHRGAFPA